MSKFRASESIAKHGVAFPYQTVTAAATVAGTAILNPAQHGREIEFVVLAGALTSVSALTIKVQKREDGGDWEDMLDLAGNPLQFTAAKTIDNAELENGFIYGTIDVGYDDAKDVRLSITPTGGNAPVAAYYRISDPLARPGEARDDLFHKTKFPNSAL